MSKHSHLVYFCLAISSFTTALQKSCLQEKVHVIRTMVSIIDKVIRLLRFSLF